MFIYNVMYISFLPRALIGVYLLSKIWMRNLLNNFIFKYINIIIDQRFHLEAKFRMQQLIKIYIVLNLI